MERVLMELLYFTATWCGPCKVFGPRLIELAEELQLNLVKIDADEHQDVVEEFGVMSLPTVVVMRDGVEATRIVGARSESALRSALS